MQAFALANPAVTYRDIYPDKVDPLSGYNSADGYPVMHHGVEMRFTEVRDLVAVAVEKDLLGAVVLEVTAATRSSWNGGDYDVRVDFAVLWRRDDEVGAHSGVIRETFPPHGPESVSVSLFWGSYHFIGLLPPAVPFRRALDAYEGKSTRIRQGCHLLAGRVGGEIIEADEDVGVHDECHSVS